MIAFAREFDSQPFHVEEDAAAGSPFGGLIASGWHTATIFMRLYVDSLLSRAASMGSPGVGRNPARVRPFASAPLTGACGEPSEQRRCQR